MQKYVKNMTIRQCTHCNSRHICRDGVRHNKSGYVQLLQCQDCRRKLSANTEFCYRQHPKEIITECLRLHVYGMSVRRIVENLELVGSRQAMPPYTSGTRGTAPWPQHT